MKNFSQTIAAQNATSASFPAIKSPAIPTDAQIGPQTLFYQTIAINFGQKYPVQIKGDYVYIEGITIDLGGGTAIYGVQGRGNITIKADTNQTPVIVNEAYREIHFPEKFTVLEFSANYPVGTIYVTFFAGFGGIRRDYEPRFINSVGSFDDYILTPATCGIGQAFSTAFAIVASCNPITQRGRITKASFLRSNQTTRSFGDVTLFLFSKTFTQVQGADFKFLPTGITSNEFLGQIRFPTFVSGNTGDWCVCDVADLSIDIFSDARDPNGYPNGTIYGCVVANTAIPFAFSGSNYLNFTVQT